MWLWSEYEWRGLISLKDGSTDLNADKDSILAPLAPTAATRLYSPSNSIQYYRSPVRKPKRKEVVALRLSDSGPCEVNTARSKLRWHENERETCVAYLKELSLRRLRVLLSKSDDSVSTRA